MSLQKFFLKEAVCPVNKRPILWCEISLSHIQFHIYSAVHRGYIVYRRSLIHTILSYAVYYDEV